MDKAKFWVIDRFAKIESEDVMEDAVVCCATSLDDAKDKIGEIIKSCTHYVPDKSGARRCKFVIVEVLSKMYFEEWPLKGEAP